MSSRLSAFAILAFALPAAAGITATPLQDPDPSNDMIAYEGTDEGWESLPPHCRGENEEGQKFFVNLPDCWQSIQEQDAHPQIEPWMKKVQRLTNALGVTYYVRGDNYEVSFANARGTTVATVSDEYGRIETVGFYDFDGTGEQFVVITDSSEAAVGSNRLSGSYYVDLDVPDLERR